MKVIQIMDNLETDGGVNSVVYDLCQAQRVLGADVSLIGIMDRGNSNNEQVQALRALGVSVHCLGAKSKPDALLRYVFSLRNLIYEISGGETVICNLHLKLSVLMGTIEEVGLAHQILRLIPLVDAGPSLLAAIQSVQIYDSRIYLRFGNSIQRNAAAFPYAET